MKFDIFKAHMLKNNNKEQLRHQTFTYIKFTIISI